MGVLHKPFKRRLSWLAPVLLSSTFAWSATTVKTQRNWPFDQRQILLASGEGQAFPDDLITAQVMDLFVKKGRVRWVTQKGGPGQIVPAEIPKDFPWQSSSAIRQLGLKFKVDGLVFLVQHGVQLDLRWYATLDGEPLFFETVSVPAAITKPDQEIRKKRLADWVADMWARIPGLGYVVKRDVSTISLEGGIQVGLKVGQALEIRRLLDVERHPLLKTLVGIRSSVSGTATVTTVGDPFSVAKVDYESAADPIQEGDRYQLRNPDAPAAGAPPAAAVSGGAPVATKPDPGGRSFIPLFGSEPEAPKPKVDDAKKKAPELKPEYGFVNVSGGLSLNKFSYQETAAGSTFGMHGWAPGLDLHAKLLITKDWLAESDFSFTAVRFNSLDAVYNSSSLAATQTSFRLRGGYRFSFLEDGPFAGDFVLSLGYRRWALSVNQIAANVAPTSKAYSGFELGFALQLPFYERYAVLVRATKLFATSLSEGPVLSGVATNHNFWDFNLGAKYRFNAVSELEAGLQWLTAASNFSGSGTRTTPATSTSVGVTGIYANYLWKF